MITSSGDGDHCLERALLHMLEYCPASSAKKYSYLQILYKGTKSLVHSPAMHLLLPFQSVSS